MGLSIRFLLNTLVSLAFPIIFAGLQALALMLTLLPLGCLYRRPFSALDNILSLVALSRAAYRTLPLLRYFALSVLPLVLAPFGKQKLTLLYQVIDATIARIVASITFLAAEILLKISRFLGRLWGKRLRNFLFLGKLWRKR